MICDSWEKVGLPLDRDVALWSTGSRVGSLAKTVSQLDQASL